jgi:hypothetical protein
MKKMLLLSIGLSVLVLWALGCGGGGGGGNSGGGNAGGGNPGGPSGGVGGSGVVGATINLSSTGADNSLPRIAAGERLRVTNNDSRAHQIMSTPHLVHTDCPGLNAIGTLGPGQSGMSDPLTSARGCGFHDHLNPDDDKFRGQVLVGLASGDPPPPDPGYLR